MGVKAEGTLKGGSSLCELTLVPRGKRAGEPPGVGGFCGTLLQDPGRRGFLSQGLGPGSVVWGQSQVRVCSLEVVWRGALPVHRGKGGHARVLRGGRGDQDCPAGLSRHPSALRSPAKEASEV